MRALRELRNARRVLKEAKPTGTGANSRDFWTFPRARAVQPGFRMYTCTRVYVCVSVDKFNWASSWVTDRWLYMYKGKVLARHREGGDGNFTLGWLLRFFGR